MVTSHVDEITEFSCIRLLLNYPNSTYWINEFSSIRLLISAILDY